jgi:hypothetical protein
VVIGERAASSVREWISSEYAGSPGALQCEVRAPLAAASHCQPRLWTRLYGCRAWLPFRSRPRPGTHQLTHTSCIKTMCHLPDHVCRPEQAQGRAAPAQAPAAPSPLQVVSVPEGYGTADALRAVAPRITSSCFVVLSGDLLTDVPVGALVAQVGRRRGGGGKGAAVEEGTFGD